jgi:hypothetical protein
MAKLPASLWSNYVHSASRYFHTCETRWLNLNLVPNIWDFARVRLATADLFSVVYIPASSSHWWIERLRQYLDTSSSFEG